MINLSRSWAFGSIITGMLLSSSVLQADEAEGVVRMNRQAPSGVVRISDQTRTGPVYRGQSVVVSEEFVDGDVIPLSHYDESTYPQASIQECPQEKHCKKHHGEKVSLQKKIITWVRNDIAKKDAWISNLLGDNYYPPPPPPHGPARPLYGCYHMVYPVNPDYFDGRDGQVYAAPGYGGPVSVPLAPVVNSTYNYGWGIPSSRLTPVLHPVKRAPVSQFPAPYATAPVSY